MEPTHNQHNDDDYIPPSQKRFASNQNRIPFKIHPPEPSRPTLAEETSTKRFQIKEELLKIKRLHRTHIVIAPNDEGKFAYFKIMWDGETNSWTHEPYIEGSDNTMIQVPDLNDYIQWLERPYDDDIDDGDFPPLMHKYFSAAFVDLASL